MLALFFLTMPTARARHGRLARRRGGLDAAGFEQAMADAGVSRTTARFLWGELAAFYHPPLQPHPDDRLESMIAIDRPEIEGIVTRFWSAMRGSDARPAGPAVGADPRVADLGRHCDFIAGWVPRGSA